MAKIHLTIKTLITKLTKKKETLLGPGLLLALPFTIETFELNAPTNGPKFGASTFEEGGAVLTAETLPAFSFAL
jgi:hypothetical protein